MARRKRFAPTARRKLIWARSIDLFQPPAVVPAAGVAVDLLAQFRADGGSSLGSTVTRVRIDLSLQLSNPGAVNPTTQDQLAVGVLVDQVQASQLEVPRPGVEEHADWMYWKRRGIFAESSTFVPLGGTPATAAIYMHAWEIDVQSQRKLEELGQTLWLVLDPSYSTGTAISAANANASVLLRLP